MIQVKSVTSFENTETAFAYKTDKELKKARFLFSCMHYPWLVKLGSKMLPGVLKMKLPVKGLIRNTIFQQFVGGETLSATGPVVQKLAQHQVRVILDYGVEGGDDGDVGYDHACDEFIRVIDYAATQPNIPFMSVKVTGIARFGLLEKLDKAATDNSGYKGIVHTEVLSDAEQAEWKRVEARLARICEAAARQSMGVLVDAEETWIQDPVDALVMQMMERYNHEKVVVYNTIQLYRHDRLAFLKASFEEARQKGFILGAKLVRGAYMEKERKRAAELGYSSPIQPDKATTDRDYNEAVEFCTQHLGQIALIVASHNEYSNQLAARLMQESALPNNHSLVHFSQLYGMSDNITFNLAGAGFSVSKYLPFGPIAEVVPYLTRRAEENSSVAGQTGRELALINKEIKRRGL